MADLDIRSLPEASLQDGSFVFGEVGGEAVKIPSNEFGSGGGSGEGGITEIPDNYVFTSENEEETPEVDEVILNADRLQGYKADDFEKAFGPVFEQSLQENLALRLITYGKMAILVFDGRITSLNENLTSGTWYNVGTLPEGKWPAFNASGALGGDGGIVQTFLAQVDTNGLIKLYVSVNGNSNLAYGQVVYFMA